MISTRQIIYQFMRSFQEHELNEIEISFDESNLHYIIKDYRQTITGMGEENFLHNLIEFYHDIMWHEFNVSNNDHD